MFIPQLDLKTALSSKEHLPEPSRDTRERN